MKTNKTQTTITAEQRTSILAEPLNEGETRIIAGIRQMGGDCVLDVDAEGKRKIRVTKEFCIRTPLVEINTTLR